jgi:hypothetical protein
MVLLTVYFSLTISALVYDYNWLLCVEITGSEEYKIVK